MTKIGYVRVSKDTQDPASQVKLMLDRGIDEKDIFTDTGISGAVKPESRVVFKQMLLRIKDKGDVDEIVFSEFSRLGRNVVDSLMTLLPLMQRNIIIRSLSAHESYINEIPPVWQPAVISLMMGAAQMEKSHNNERTKWGIENARSKGKIIGRPVVNVDFQKVKDTMAKYNLKEKQAIRVCEYSESTYYKAKKGVVSDV